VLLGFLLLQAAAANQPPVAKPEYMRYMRALNVPAAQGQACAVLDAQTFEHAAPSLVDLRVFPATADAHEVPYAITLSQALTEDTQQARVLNLGMQGNKIVFDLEMPQRAYTSVTLALDPTVHDFLATATVTGEDAPGADAHGRSLGTFTLFDLSSQHLSRYTTLPLQESTFRYLHIVLKIVPAPGHKEMAASVPNGLHFPGMPEYSSSTSGENSNAMRVLLRVDWIAGFGPQIVQGAQVPPSREAQIIYTTVAETSQVQTAGRESIARLEIPARVPVERVEFVLSPNFKGNFSRDVRISATAEPAPKKTAVGAPGTQTQADLENDRRASLPEVVTGNILRVHTTEAGREIHTDQLGIPAILGANLQRPAKVEVTIENGDDQPLPIAAVRLQMRQRRLCFDASAASGAALSLYYGDPALAAPVYDYDRLFVPSSNPLNAALGPEQQNPQFTPRPVAPLSFTERHPQVLWIALIAVICVLGAVAVRASKNVGR
jgi:hypothetical protein